MDRNAQAYYYFVMVVDKIGQNIGTGHLREYVKHMEIDTMSIISQI